MILSDNITLSTNVGSGAVLATDDIGGVQHQRVKVEFGTDGSATDVSSSNPLPVTLAASGGLTSLQLLDDVVGTISSTAPTKVSQVGGIDPSGNSRAVLIDCSNRMSVAIGSSVSLALGTALPAGSNNIGDVDIASAIPAGTNLIGIVKIGDGVETAAVDASNRLETTSYQGSTWQTQDIPGTSGGVSVNRLVVANSTNPTVVKASAGQLYGYEIYNASGAHSYVKFVNKATSPTAGSETIVLTVQIPTLQTVRFWFPQGIAFATGISFFTVTGAADSNSTAVAASDLIIQAFYK